MSSHRRGSAYPLTEEPELPVSTLAALCRHIPPQQLFSQELQEHPWADAEAELSARAVPLELQEYP